MSLPSPIGTGPYAGKDGAIHGRAKKRESGLFTTGPLQDEIPAGESKEDQERIDAELDTFAPGKGWLLIHRYQDSEKNPVDGSSEDESDSESSGSEPLDDFEKAVAADTGHDITKSPKMGHSTKAKQRVRRLPWIQRRRNHRPSEPPRPGGQLGRENTRWQREKH